MKNFCLLTSNPIHRINDYLVLLAGTLVGEGDDPVPDSERDRGDRGVSDRVSLTRLFGKRAGFVTANHKNAVGDGGKHP